MTQAAKHEADKAEDTTKQVTSEVAEATRNGADKTAEVTRDLLKAGAQSATALGGELQKQVGAAGVAQRETLRKSVEGTAELGKLYADLFKEQAEHGQQVAKAFGKTFDWNEAMRVQNEYVRASFERVSRLNSRYVEIVQAVMTSAVSTAKAQAKKAA